jgi:5-methylcytosine-specific restriction endonuclease McrA
METLVLSSAYQPMTHIPWQKAISMWFAGRVEIVSVYEDKFIRTVDEVFQMPSIVRFVGNVFKRFKHTRGVKFNRENVFIRDEGSCQYCSKELSRENFTLDHVIPISQGGKKNWKNIVSCCKDCNQRKGNRTPKQASMQLLKTPVIPKKLIVPARDNFRKSSIPSEWESYLAIDIV